MKLLFCALIMMFTFVVCAKELGKPVPPKDVAKSAPVKKEKVKVDKALTTEEFAEVDAWVGKKVKSGAMTKEQGEAAMKHAAALKKVMDSEKPKKGAK